jgi:hypothetical protein
VPRADIKRATPFSRPRDTRAALAFFVACALVAGLYFPESSVAGPAVGPDGMRSLGGPKDEREDPFVAEDLDYARSLVEELRQVARDENDPGLDAFSREVEELLAKAERGEISKEELLEQMAKAEQHYMEGTNEEDMEEAMSDLKETGAELKKSPLTREVGKALEDGDLAKAQQELEKLAQKLDNQELSDKQREEMARTLDKAAEKFEQKDQKRDEQTDKQMEEKREEMRQLKRQLDSSKNEAQKEQLKRRLDRKERDLKRLERDKERRAESQQRRTLKQIHRNMKKAAEDTADE